MILGISWSKNKYVFKTLFFYYNINYKYNYLREIKLLVFYLGHSIINHYKIKKIILYKFKIKNLNLNVPLRLDPIPKINQKYK